MILVEMHEMLVCFLNLTFQFMSFFLNCVHFGFFMSGLYVLAARDIFETLYHPNFSHLKVSFVFVMHLLPLFDLDFWDLFVFVYLWCCCRHLSVVLRFMVENFLIY